MQRLRSSVAAKGKRPAGRRQRVCNFGPPNLCNLRPPPTTCAQKSLKKFMHSTLRLSWAGQLEDRYIIRRCNTGRDRKDNGNNALHHAKATLRARARDCSSPRGRAPKPLLATDGAK